MYKRQFKAAQAWTKGSKLFEQYASKAVTCGASLPVAAGGGGGPATPTLLSTAAIRCSNKSRTFWSSCVPDIFETGVAVAFVTFARARLHAMTRSVAASAALRRLVSLRARAMSADDLAFGWPWQNCGKLLVSYNASYISALRLVWDATQQYRRLWRRVGALSTTRGAAHRAFFVSQRPVKSPSQFVINRSCVLVESLHTIAACCRRPISNCRRAACSQQQISRGALKSCQSRAVSYTHLTLPTICSV